MSHLSKIFEEAPIKVQNRNGFDLSHVHAGTSKCGQLVPVLTKLLVPNSTISLGVNAEVSLPPIVSPFYGKIDFCIEGFIVPLSILYGGWKQFISNNEVTQFPLSQSGLTAGSNAYTANTVTSSRSPLPATYVGKNGYSIPCFDVFDVADGDIADYTTLANTNDNIYEYMGASFANLYNYDSSEQKPGFGTLASMLPGLAYHKIVDTFYRNTKLTRTWFAVNPNLQNSTLNTKNVSLVWHSFYSIQGGGGTSPLFSSRGDLTFPDGVSFFSTRQRTYARDYFTSAVQSPQQGGSSVLRFSVSTGVTTTGEFTINSLRMANSLQKFLETNNLSGDYADMVRNRWGVRPIDADFDEPHYLGRVVIPVYQHTVYQNNQGSAAQFESKNPFINEGTLGAKGGDAGTSGEGSICDNFNVTSWSYLMCLASLVPHANYNYGNNRELFAVNLGDYPAPELQGVGMEEIKNYEIFGALADSAVTASDYANTFGYTQRYARFKYMDDRVSGALRPGKSLEYFQLQRNFEDYPQLGTNFVTISQDALEGVLSVNTETMNLSCWWEIFFKFHVVMPLAEYCIPTLGELQDTHTIKTTQGGSRL